mgnify:CR=1 FL=1
MHPPLRAKRSKLSAREQEKQRKKIGLSFRIPEEVNETFYRLCGQVRHGVGFAKSNLIYSSYIHTSVKLEDAEVGEEEENGDDVKDEGNT